MNLPTPEQLSEYNIHLFLEHYGIKNEQGLAMEFHDHSFLWDVFEDMSPLQCVIKAPQIGMTTLEIIKSFWVAKNLGKDIIYTLPTQSDVHDMASGKINRILAQNPIFREWVKDHDSVEHKRVGANTIYYRGTFTAKQAMMVSSALNIHDEVDASDRAVIEQYETRLQAVADGWRWYFSHPSLPDTGIDKVWQLSDQKHWFITCPACEKEQYLDWPDSIDKVRKCFVCKLCSEPLSDEARRKGRWIPRYSGEDLETRPFSGYWISQLMCPWITADKILDDFNHKSPEYFWNYVLGLPYAGGDAKLTQLQLMQNLTGTLAAPDVNERVVIGIDTGLRIDYVMGNQRLGLFFQGDCTDYNVLDSHMRRWPNAIAIIDAGGDMIGSRAFFERWRGRVFLCYTNVQRSGNEFVIWGEEEKEGEVHADRNRTIQLVVDEFREHRIPLQGSENDWWEYWLDWKNLSRINVEDPKTHEIRSHKWVREGRDHRAMATAYWRIGISKFGVQEQVEFVVPGTFMPQTSSFELDGTFTRGTQRLKGA